jgi:hypothetical protein
MQKIEIEKFKEYCNKKFCLRKTFVNDKCLTESKQNYCYIRYNVVTENQQRRQKYRKDYQEKNKEKIQSFSKLVPSISLSKMRIIEEHNRRLELLKKDSEKLSVEQKENTIKWQEVRKKLFERDKSCRVWLCLSQSEKSIILSTFLDQISMFKDIDDAAHIKPRSTHPELYYDLDNLLRINRYFHILLDTYRHPVTQRPITAEERENWFKRIKEYPQSNNEDLN